ncbi:tetratricopeptide repeat protein [Edaphobacter aggregans]|uniref:tetratricopeptide repeat protein n=1 Tax=Edaphobacter aggregans TaxID=570835 RepID=UPI000554D692|nr:tetratricopeptide repeat protein [Edaphobacter aggregans]
MTRKILLPIYLTGCLLGSTPVRAQQDQSAQLVRRLQERVKRSPDDYAGYAALGAAYLQKGRETADATEYELARVALEKSLDLLSNGPAAAFPMTQMAALCMVEHRFQDALTWAQNALAQGSGDPAPWALVGDALADMGDYAEAEEAYSKLQSLYGSEDTRLAMSYQQTSRLSYLRFIAGDTSAATQLLRKAVQMAIEMHMPAENIAWSEYQLGEQDFHTGDLVAAERAYQAALDEYPGYYRALVGLAKLRAAQGRYGESIKLYKEAIAKVPYPEFAAALGDIYQKIGQSQQAAKQYQLVELIGRLNEINQQIHNRDLALFYADHGLELDRSLALARKELEVRHDIYTWDVLAWSLFKNGKLREASEAITHALQWGTKDAQIFFHAGMIYEQLGDSAKSKDYLRRALETNPHFHVVFSELAIQALARLNSKPLATNSGEGGHAH